MNVITKHGRTSEGIKKRIIGWNEQWKDGWNDQYIDEPMNQWINESMNQWINEPMNQLNPWNNE